MKKYLLLFLLVVISGSIKAQPPNNTIFFGGVGDGIALATNNAAPNNLFFGGTGDGFSFESNNAVSNNIFQGSTGDGFSNNANVSVPNAIYKGGEGDGWHAVIFPLGPLPVKLLSFTAEQQGKLHLVKWVTAEEINTKHFEVQRSANGSAYETIGIVMPSGTATSGASYRFTVHEPWNGNNFYRLKITDLDGSVSYSNIVLLKNVGDLQVSVYPNPAADELYIKIPPEITTVDINAEIIDMNGKIVLKTILQAGRSNNILIKKLAAGTYSLRSIINNQPFILRFVKTN